MSDDDNNVIEFSTEQLKAIKKALAKDDPAGAKKVAAINRSASNLKLILQDAYRYLTSVDKSKPAYLVHIDKQGVVHQASEQTITIKAHAHAADLFGRRDVDDIAIIAKRALMQPDTLLHNEQVAPFRWQGEPGLCHCRLPFKREDTAELPPVFAEFLSRIETPEEARALVLWFGSILDLQMTDRAQYLYLHGEGGDGKSSVVSAIGAMFGRGYYPVSSDALSGRFGTACLEGIRLLDLSDSNASSFVTTTLFKRITGEAYLNVEQKGEPMRVIPLLCKTVVTSNYPPESSGKNADERRLIYVRVRAHGTDTNTNVMAEMLRTAPDFLRYCDTQYRQWRTDNAHKEIPVSAEARKVVRATSIEEEAKEVFDALFELLPGDASKFLAAAGVKSDVAKMCQAYRSSVAREVMRMVRSACGPSIRVNSHTRAYIGIQRASSI